MSGIQKGGLSVAIQRLQQDYLRLSRDSVPFVTAHPLHSNMFEWHYVVKGPPDSPYCGGFYHGKLVFPKDYPFRPPAIYMITPNGRFACDTRLCLSISDFHPDAWNPAWSVATILTGLLSFMLETTPTTGSIITSTAAKRAFARRSGEFNLKDDKFIELFPDVVEEIQLQLKASNSSTRRPVRSGTSDGIDDAFANHEGTTGQLPMIFVVVIFGIFAVSVKLVIDFLNEPV